MKVLRESKDSLMAMLEAFVYDPLISWRLLNNNVDGETRLSHPDNNWDHDHEPKSVVQLMAEDLQIGSKSKNALGRNDEPASNLKTTHIVTKPRTDTAPKDSTDRDETDAEDSGDMNTRLVTMIFVIICYLFLLL